MATTANISDHIIIRQTQNPAEITAAQRLRYKVFYEEYGATSKDTVQSDNIDVDKFDKFSDHLIVINTQTDDIIGTYRLLQKGGADKVGQFYTSDEYDITALKNSNKTLLELGRSCVLKEFRTRPVMQLLWQGIADYVIDNDIDLMFGCASFQTTDIDTISTQLSYLHHFHGCSDGLTPRALKHAQSDAFEHIDMNIIQKDDINQRRAFASLPALIKGYLRIGATIGEGAVIDHDFKCTDVCIVVQTEKITSKYVKHYERKLNKSLHKNERTSVTS